jgi:hypothetical protein
VAHPDPLRPPDRERSGQAEKASLDPLIAPATRAFLHDQNPKLPLSSGPQPTALSRIGPPSHQFEQFRGFAGV